MDNFNTDDSIKNGMSMWYFYSDTESNIIGKIEKVSSEEINIDNITNGINITFYDGQDLIDYLYTHKGVKLFIKREYTSINCADNKAVKLIEKFSSVDFDLSEYVATDCLCQKSINLNNVQFLSRRQSAVKEIYEFW